LGNSCISIYSSEPEAYNIVEIYFSEVKFFVLSIFEEKFQIERHLEFISRLFSKKTELKIKFSKTLSSQKVFLNILNFLSYFL
jgi:hypothetical protein